MAKTYSFDVSAPANSAAPSGGAAAIRLLKNALHERNNQDHYWEKSGDTADVDDVGFHRKVTLLERTAPTQKTNAGILYTKVVATKAELFFRDEDGDEVQLTSGGAINVDSAFASTDFILTALSTKSGWTDVTTTYAGKYLRVGATAKATGGNATHTHTGPSHTHAVSGTTASTAANSCSDEGGTCSRAAMIAHTHEVSLTSGAGGTGATGSANLDPVYVDVRMFQKD